MAASYYLQYQFKLKKLLKKYIFIWGTRNAIKEFILLVAQLIFILFNFNDYFNYQNDMNDTILYYQSCIRQKIWQYDSKNNFFLIYGIF